MKMAFNSSQFELIANTVNEKDRSRHMSSQPLFRVSLSAQIDQSATVSTRYLTYGFKTRNRRPHRWTELILQQFDCTKTKNHMPRLHTHTHPWAPKTRENVDDVIFTIQIRWCIRTHHITVLSSAVVATDTLWFFNFFLNKCFYLFTWINNYGHWQNHPFSIEFVKWKKECQSKAANRLKFTEITRIQFNSIHVIFH